jgi:hypothetical protein
MSYKIRKNLRVCADWILSILCGNPLEDINPLVDDWFRYKFDTYSTRQLMALEDYTLEDLNAAIRLLLRNGHIKVSVILLDVPHMPSFKKHCLKKVASRQYLVLISKLARLWRTYLYTKAWEMRLIK